MSMSDRSLSLNGWDIRHNAEVAWIPWGANSDAYVNILGEADGYTVALIRADTGYTTAPHEHAHAEFLLLPP